MKAISTASFQILYSCYFSFYGNNCNERNYFACRIKNSKATEIKKMEKILVSYIYVGKPIKRLRASDKELPKIQLNDAFASVKDIQTFIATERDEKDEKEIPYMTVS